MATSIQQASARRRLIGLGSVEIGADGIRLTKLAQVAPHTSAAAVRAVHIPVMLAGAASPDNIVSMKFAVLIYNDPRLLGELPTEEFNTTMRGCLGKADGMRQRGALLDSQMLEDTSTARSIRVRKGRVEVTDGPFAEAKEVLGGFNIIEARDMDEAIALAMEFPWAATGCVEVRPVRDIESVRRTVGA
jgi:hypothetical protein